jgi:penicillin-binding protein 2
MLPMRRFLRRHIPSMFQRRLLLLAGCAVAAMALLGLRTAQLTLGEASAASRRVAEERLKSSEVIPTVRGRILDRHGRVLAEDEPGWDVAVHYSVIDGSWAQLQARSAAARDNRESGGELDDEELKNLRARYQALFEEQVEGLWQHLAELGGVDRVELERRKSEIVQRVQQVASHHWAQRREKMVAELEEPIAWSDAYEAVQEQGWHYPILVDVDDAVRDEVQKFVAEADRLASASARAEKYLAGGDALKVWRQIELRRPLQRRYPFETLVLEVDRSQLPGELRDELPLEVRVEGVTTHLVGMMRDVLEADLAGAPGSYGGERSVGNRYLPGDLIGRMGIEKSMEARLRGQRGTVVRRLDTQEEEERIEPLPGRDVRLTIDTQLQARVAAILSPEIGLMKVQPWHHSKAAERGEVGRPLNGAAVVLDVASGEILAEVSVPAMPLRVLQEEPRKIYHEPWGLAYLNRPVEAKYPCGSTIKPMMLVAAVTCGAHELGRELDCPGMLDPNDPEHFRCWIFKAHGQPGHGPLDGAKAIEVSCNVYFFKLARAMGVERTALGYSQFGLGRLTGCGLDEEVRGDLPDAQGDLSRYGPADAINMGIGQGPVAWTPLQAAAAYATLARGGVYLPPTVIADEDRLTPRQAVDLKLNQAAVAQAMAGLDGVVNGPEGTGRWLTTHSDPIFTVEGVKIYGKSGTADPGGRWVDLGGVRGKPDEGDLFLDSKVVDDHSWFVALVQPAGQSRPTHVIAVVVEYAGSGSKVAGPIVNQVLLAMKQEGYLP